MKISCLGLVCFLTACVDNNYDLSDIDTTVRVNVNNLVIPVKVDEVKLETIFDLNTDSSIKEVDGEYVVIEDGSFTSTDVEIDKFSLGSTDIESTIFSSPFDPVVLQFNGQGNVDLEFHPKAFHYSTYDVPREIVEINYVDGSFSLLLELEIKGLQDVVSEFEVQDLVIQFPKNLVLIENAGGSYNPETGEITIPNRHQPGTKMQLNFVASRLDFKGLGGKYDHTTHHLEVDGDFYVKSGHLLLKKEHLIANPKATTLNINFHYATSDLLVKSFTGDVKYDIENVNINDVDLSDLPDVLNQSGTDISIANPQIYLSLNNPLQEYALKAQTGLKICGLRPDADPVVTTLDDDYFTIGTDSPNGIYEFCLSPNKPDKYYAGYTEASHIAYTSLSNILSGNGLPNKLSIDLIDPCIPVQHVSEFRLGENLKGVEGTYTFVAPIALKKGSTIKYTDVIDNWHSEELDHLVIETLEVKLNVTSQLPVSLDLTAYPIDVHGNQINNVVVEGAKIDANANNQELTITISGEVRGIDGIRFTALGLSDSETALSPNMTISLSNVRPCVSGYYEDEL